MLWAAPASASAGLLRWAEQIRSVSRGGLCRRLPRFVCPPLRDWGKAGGAVGCSFVRAPRPECSI